MQLLTVKKVTISIVGLSVEFSHDPLKIFYTLPGSIRANTKKKYLFPAKYDVDEFFYFLDSLPKKSPAHLLDADLCPTVRSRTFRFKMYKPGTGKPIPGFENYELRGINHEEFFITKDIS